jgi:hypothetical protein
VGQRTHRYPHPPQSHHPDVVDHYIATELAGDPVNRGKSYATRTAPVSSSPTCFLQPVEELALPHPPQPPAATFNA